MPKTILIIDDEEKPSALVSVFLEQKGYCPVCANNGKQGLKAARYRSPDLILLDMDMPRMDGLAVLKKLKDDPKTMSIPVIILVRHGDDYSKVRAASLYSEGYITKPFEPEHLESKISQLLQILSGSTEMHDRESQASE
jgi:DNA-binding response OmpR family regulator